MKSPFKTLGLPPSATKAQIKSKFYELSKKYHPDRMRHKPEDEQQHSEKRYREITEAYELLSDPSKLEQYRSQEAHSTSTSSSASTGASSYDYYGSTRDARAQYRSSHGHARPSGLYRERERSRVFNYGRPYNPNHDAMYGGYRPHSKHDVPHFDYDKHYSRHLAYDQFRRSQREAAKNKDPQAPPPSPIGLAGTVATLAVTIVIAYSLFS
uniref:ARAD1B06358p n=1 Tax=Blastobotrys adeninivorans TaxID=409370 RepID=A0A060TB91_BLAAD